MIDWKQDRIEAALRGENPTVMRRLSAGFAGAAARRRPVWLYPVERWSDPATALGPDHDDLRAELIAEIDRLRSRS